MIRILVALLVMTAAASAQPNPDTDLPRVPVPYSPTTPTDWTTKISEAIPTTFINAADYLASYFSTGRRVCDFGTYENRLRRWQYTSTGGTKPIPGKQIFLDEDNDNNLDVTEPMGWVVMDYGTGSTNGYVLQFDQTSIIRGSLGSGGTWEEVGASGNTIGFSGSPVEIGVYPCEVNTGFGFIGVEEVKIHPLRTSSTDEGTAIDWVKAVETAWYYCNDNNRKDSSTAGQNVNSGCVVNVTPGTYQASGSKYALMRARRQASSASFSETISYKFNGNGSVIYNALSTPSSVTASQLGSGGNVCDETTAGERRVITDAKTWHDRTGGTDTLFDIIAAVGADDNDADECDGISNGGVCDWGIGSVKVTLDGNHDYDDGDLGNDDGSLRVQGTYITISGSADNTCNKNWLVKHAGSLLGDDEFIFTPESPCLAADLVGAQVSHANSCVSCNGNYWVEGCPLESYGGPTIGSLGDTQIRDLFVHDISYRVVSGTYNRPVGIRIDGFTGTGLGGVNGAHIENVNNQGQADDYGQILIHLHQRPYMVAPTGGSVCQDITLENIESDFWGRSAQTILLDGCSNVFIKGFYSQHGGGYWQRFADNSTHNPGGVVMTANLEGARDGPQVIFENGEITVHGRLCGDQASGSAGPRRDACAIFGHLGSARAVRIHADGVTWQSGNGSRKRAVHHLNKVRFRQAGGAISLNAKGESSDADHYFAAAHSGSSVETYVLQNPKIIELTSVAPADVDLYGEFSTPTYPTDAEIRPGVIGDMRTAIFQVADTDGAVSPGCMRTDTVPGDAAKPPVSCGTATAGWQNTVLPILGGGRPWFQYMTCTWMGSSPTTDWDASEGADFTIRVNTSASTEDIRIFPIINTTWPIFTKQIFRAPTVILSHMVAQLEVENITGLAAETLPAYCTVAYDTLVPH